jgi:hypothetical protein
VSQFIARSEFAAKKSLKLYEVNESNECTNKTDLHNCTAANCENFYQAVIKML